MVAAAPLGRSHGHHRADLVAVSGQVSRPPLGSSYWPLTLETRSYTDHLIYMLVWRRGVVTRNLTGALLGCRWTDQSGPAPRLTAPAGPGMTSYEPDPAARDLV